MTPRVFEGEGLLEGKTVFLSASRPSREKRFFRVANEAEMEEGVRSLARAVFAERGRLVFGAHPSISPLIVEVATEYFDPQWNAAAGKERPVTIYQSEAFQDAIPPATRALESLGYAKILWTEDRNGERYNPSNKDEEQCIESLAHMRDRMFKETKPVAMVAAGGMEGIVREAQLFLEMFPGNIYVLTSFGGAAEKLMEYLETNFLKEERPIAAPPWRHRVIPVESRWGVPAWESFQTERAELPAHPWALVMQRVVRHIAAKDDE
jgi:hypothetical protein